VTPVVRFALVLFLRKGLFLLSLGGYIRAVIWMLKYDFIRNWILYRAGHM